MHYLIIGGTGSLGKAFINQIYPDHTISVLSREEIKQVKLKEKFPDVHTIIGDVRDKYSLDHAIAGCDAVFNFAALKHVDICEENQTESLKVNLIGAMNVADLCHKHKVPYGVFSSSDKAVLPINVYGLHKAAAERYYMDKNFQTTNTRYSVFRWGNVLGSRGSVIHKFKASLEKEQCVYITHSEMTRFWIHIDDVAKFMLENYTTPTIKIAHIPKMKSSSVLNLAQATAKVLGVNSYNVKMTAVRRGEKIHECLQSEHEKDGGCFRSDNCEQYTMDELCQLVERTL